MKVSDLPALAGKTLGPTEWSSVSQEEVNVFADLTNDHNFIHVDPVKAKEPPFGGTIVHGYLAMSMLAPVVQGFLPVEDASVSINYGLDKLRFPAPLPVGARYRVTGEVLSVEEVKGGIQTVIRLSVEVEGSDKPTLVADGVFRFYA